MAKCQRCDGRGELDFFQLSGYFDCPDCGGTGIAPSHPERTAFFKDAADMMRKIGAALWSLVKFLSKWGFAAGVVFGVLLVLAMPTANRRNTCEAAGGVFVMGGTFDANECWSEDGTRRLFPKGWR